MKMKKFDYEKPEIVDLDIPVVNGESCLIDCGASDDICPTSDDEF